jgi:butyryl-CoA dehydrogenase
MNFDFTDEQESFRQVIADFAKQEIAPHISKWDQDHYFPVDAVKKLGTLGAFGVSFPEAYGGGGGDFTTLCLAIEELAKVDSSIAITLSAGVGLGANPIYKFGSEEQRNRWLPEMCAGSSLGAFGLTEPDGGSDAGATRSSYAFDDRRMGFVINGSKAYITNSGTPITSVITITARGDDGISAFLVPSGTSGLTVEPPYRKLGWHSSDTHGLSLVDVFVGKEDLLGQPGRGFAQFLSILDDGRVAIAALACGLISACLDIAVDHANSRNAFGGPISRFQGVSFMCSEIAIKLEVARTMVYRAAWLKDMERPFKKEAAIAKAYSTEAAIDATRLALQVTGGAGFIEDSPIARHYRDAKILEIGEGTSEIQRLVIARELGLKL